MKQGVAFHLSLIAGLVLLAGCATEEYKPMPSMPPQATAGANVPPKGVYHKVLAGQTLWQIAQGYGVSISDIISSNNIPNGSALEPGQLLFIPGAVSVKDISAGHAVDNNKTEFTWPIRGKVVMYFDDPIAADVHSRGIDIQAQAGDTVHATREGQVVLADYMSGYGQTVMIDHKDGFITVYARNARLLVKLGDHVYKGDPIAEVGPMAGRVVEHFEIRRGSQAMNPLYYLP